MIPVTLCYKTASRETWNFLKFLHRKISSSIKMPLDAAKYHANK